MQIGMVGLGRMGSNMVRRLVRAGHEAVAFDVSPAAVEALIADCPADRAASIEELASKLRRPRTAWIMVPAGDPAEHAVAALAEHLDEDDVVVDGGNSYYKDDVRRSRSLRKRGIHYVDVGTSGGVWGLDRGFSLMIGGEPAVVDRLDPIFQALAPGVGDVPRTPGRPELGTAERGYLHCGPAGAGHFVKMVHNGIEYGLMQAYAEGFDIFANAGSDEVDADFRYDFDLAEIAEVWRRGSVIGSWLLDLTATALVEDPELGMFSGFVRDSGEGRWTIEAAIERSVPVPVLSASLFSRFRSRRESTFAEKVLSAMRHKFGGHVELPSGG